MAYTFDLSGGHLALDFANTVDGTRDQPREDAEHLRTYGDVLDFATQAGTLADGERRRLARAAAAHPAQAASAHKRAIALREAVFGVFDARAEGRPEPEAAVATIDREARIASARRVLRRHDGAVAYAWESADEVDRPLWPLAIAAAELLTSREERVVKECASETCDWLFVDRSRNRSRRWCDMTGCGNRAKARRFYERKKKATKRGPAR